MEQMSYKEMSRLRWLVCVAGIICLVTPSKSRSQETNNQILQRLLALAPSISSSSKETDSIAIHGRFTEKLGNALLRGKFSAYYKSPNQFSMIWTDAVDDTPVLFSTDGKSMLYDPIGSSILIESMAVVRGCLRASDGILGCAFTAYESRTENNQILIDLKSIANIDYVATAIVSENNSIYKIVCESAKKYKFVFYVDSKDKIFPYKKFQVYPDGDLEPIISLDQIVINEAINPDVFRFPLRELRGGKLPIARKRVRDGIIPTTQPFYARSVLRGAMARNHPDFPELLNKDWDEFAKTDRILSETLKKVFKEIR